MRKLIDKRRFPRTREYGPLKLKIEREASDGPARVTEAALWDFSEGGLGMDSPRAFATGEILTVRGDFYGAEYSMGIEARARVAYCRRVEIGKYRVGVAFLDVSYRRLAVQEEQK